MTKPHTLLLFWVLVVWQAIRNHIKRSNDYYKSEEGWKDSQW